LCGFRFSLGPLDQQPFFRGAAATPIITTPGANPPGGFSPGPGLSPPRGG
jgi:hypothetical protein